jgi:hypothetical protein
MHTYICKHIHRAIRRLSRIQYIHTCVCVYTHTHTAISRLSRISAAPQCTQNMYMHIYIHAQSDSATILYIHTCIHRAILRLSRTSAACWTMQRKRETASGRSIWPNRDFTLRLKGICSTQGYVWTCMCVYESEYDCIQ